MRFPRPAQRGRDRRHGLATAVLLAVFLFGLAGAGYGLHVQMESGRTALAAAKFAAIAGALREGPVIFVPMQGDDCRRRLIDNATWTISDGGIVPCGQAGLWDQAAMDAQHNIGQRLDMMRTSFRTKNSGAD